MKVSTKGRYALRIMIDLAEHAEAEAVSVSELSARQDVSVKYAEAIVAALQRAGLIHSRRGKTGGYALCRAPSEITVWDILSAGEGSLSAVSCLCGSPNLCPRAPRCKTLPFWRALNGRISEFCKSVALSDLGQGYAPQESIIK